MNKHFPDVAVIGVPRSGTTFLWSLMKQHPHLSLPEKKESHFFSLPELLTHTGGPGDKKEVKGLKHDFDEYCKRYPTSSIKQGVKTVDVSPSYFFYPESIRRILEINPECKFLLIFRNPVEKSYSHYKLRKQQGRETLSFTEALQAEAHRKQQKFNDFWLYKESALYSEKLEKIVREIPKGNLKIIWFDDLIKHTKEIWSSVCGYLEISEIEIQQSARSVEKNTSYLPKWKGTPQNLRRITQNKLFPTRLASVMEKVYQKIFLKEFEDLDEETKKYLEAFFSEDHQRTKELIKNHSLELVC